jgi:hypothetical protein
MQKLSLILKPESKMTDAGADSMAEMLPPGVTVRGLFDSPLWVNEQPAAASIVPLQNETQAVYGLVNATARLGAACAAAYPAPEEQWKCLFGAGVARLLHGNAFC